MRTSHHTRNYITFFTRSILELEALTALLLIGKRLRRHKMFTNFGEVCLIFLFITHCSRTTHSPSSSKSHKQEQSSFLLKKKPGLKVQVYDATPAEQSPSSYRSLTPTLAPSCISFKPAHRRSASVPMNNSPPRLFSGAGDRNRTSDSPVLSPASQPSFTVSEVDEVGVPPGVSICTDCLTGF